jgi:hypothetical protein
MAEQKPESMAITDNLTFCLLPSAFSRRELKNIDNFFIFHVIIAAVMNYGGLL